METKRSSKTRVKQGKPSGQLIGTIVGNRWGEFTSRQRERIEAMVRSLDDDPDPIIKWFYEEWNRCTDQDGNTMPLPGGWQRSMQRWIGFGLLPGDFIEAIET